MEPRKSSFSGAGNDSVYALLVGNTIRLYESDRPEDPGMVIVQRRFREVAEGLQKGIFIQERGGDDVAIVVDFATGEVVTTRRQLAVFVRGLAAGEFNDLFDPAEETEAQVAV